MSDEVGLVATGPTEEVRQATQQLVVGERRQRVSAFHHRQYRQAFRDLPGSRVTRSMRRTLARRGPGTAARLVGALRAVHASFRAGQRRLAEGLLKLVKGKVKKKRISTATGQRKGRADHARAAAGSESRAHHRGLTGAHHRGPTTERSATEGSTPRGQHRGSSNRRAHKTEGSPPRATTERLTAAGLAKEGSRRKAEWNPVARPAGRSGLSGGGGGEARRHLRHSPLEDAHAVRIGSPGERLLESKTKPEAAGGLRMRALQGK